MSMPTNILQQVQTYNMSGLAFLQNFACFINTSNKKFKDFNKNIPANLGDTVNFELPPRMTTNNSLVAVFQGADQRIQSLVCDQAQSVAYAFTAQQFIFNVEDYMERFGKSAIVRLGMKVESDVASVCEKYPYRFYGDGVTAIDSYQKLAQALANFRNFGSVLNNMAECYIQDTAVPAIIASGLSQFALNRNNEDAMSWELGDFANANWYQSNLLPVHIAGSEGAAATTLTVVSTTLNAEGAVTAITFSGASAASDLNSVKKYDSFQFQDGVSGQPNLRFLNFTSYTVTSLPLQFIATADAASTAGSQVTVSINPPLQVQQTNSQNINYPIVAGMQVKVLPSHRCGVITSGKPLYLAMPMLPEEVPFPTSSLTDPDTGASIRQYYGSLFGQNQRGMIHDTIYGYTLVPEYSMKLVFPL